MSSTQATDFEPGAPTRQPTASSSVHVAFPDLESQPTSSPSPLSPLSPVSRVRTSASVTSPVSIRRRARASTRASRNTPEGSPAGSRRESVDTLRRRPARSNTVRAYHSPTRQAWEATPGAEPGVDLSAEPAGEGEEGASPYAGLRQACDITVVDFSEDRVEQRELDNATLEAFLREEKPSWVACRWVNVNGLSWDVIRLLGSEWKLHGLAIEDMVSTRGRTKADWYSDHAFS